jgi:alpha-L-fucosidase 2
MENPWPGEKVQLIRDGKNAEVLMGKALTFNTRENEKINLKSASK